MTKYMEKSQTNDQMLYEHYMEDSKQGNDQKLYKHCMENILGGLLTLVAENNIICSTFIILNAKPNCPVTSMSTIVWSPSAGLLIDILVRQNRYSGLERQIWLIEMWKFDEKYVLLYCYCSTRETTNRKLLPSGAVNV